MVHRITEELDLAEWISEGIMAFEDLLRDHWFFQLWCTVNHRE